MRLGLALVLSGMGLAFGLAFDLFGQRGRRRKTSVAESAERPLAAVSPGPQADRSPGSLAAVLPRPPAMEPQPRLRTRDAGVTLGATKRQLSTKLVGGMDGCRHGWILIVTSAEEAGASIVSVVADVKEVVALLDSRQIAAVAIDIPIGLPAVGPRSCDVAARKLLGPRRSSVFPTPPRATLGSSTYAAACATSRSACGKAMSKQTFGILPKIEAVDRLMTPDRQRSLVEVHPEVGFTVLAGRPMAHRKATDEGRAERLAALRTVFPDIDEHADTWLPGSRPDDVLDAFVAAWSARRWLNGSYQRLGGEEDERGLRMEIIV